MTTVTLTVLVAGFVLLAWAGRDVSAYALFIGGPVVSAVVGVLITRRVATVSSDLAAVKHQTNSLLSVRLDTIDGELAAAAQDRAEKAPGPPL